MSTGYYLLLLAGLVVSGCVGKTRYNQTLSELNKYKQDLESVQDELSSTQSERDNLEKLLGIVSKEQEKTISEDKGEYPKQESPLCKWSTGQCDFFEHCVKDD